MEKPTAAQSKTSAFMIIPSLFALISLFSCGSPTTMTQKTKVASPIILTADDKSVNTEDRKTLIITPTHSPIPTFTLTPTLSLVSPDARIRLGSGSIHQMAASRDGKAVLVSGPLGLFSYTAENMERELEIPTASRVLSAAISSNGSRIASISKNGEIDLWDGADGGNLWKIPPGSHTSSSNRMGYDDHPGTEIVFSPDDKMIAVAITSGMEVFLLNASSGEQILQLSSYMDTETANVSALAFSPDGKTLAALNFTKGVDFWDTSSGTQLPSGVLVSYDSRSIAYSPDGKTLAFNNANTVNFLDIESQTIRTATGEHGRYITAIAFSPDGKTVVSGSMDKTVKVWNPMNGSLVRTLSGHTDFVTGVGFTKNGGQIISGSLDGNLIAWNAASGARMAASHDFQNQVESISISPDGTLLAAGYKDGSIILWGTEDGSYRLMGSKHSDRVIDMAFSPDDTTFASGSADGTIILWSAGAGQQKTVLKADRWDVLTVDFSPDGAALASGYAKNALVVWNVSTGGSIKTLHFGRLEDAPAVSKVAYSSDGKKLMTLLENTGDRTAAVEVLDTSNWEVISLRQNKAFYANPIDFSKDGKYFVTSAANKVSLWDVEISELTRIIEGLAGKGINQVAISPNNKFIASTYFFSGDVQIWDAEKGELLKTLKGHNDGMNDLAFSADGKILASASFDGTIILWNIR
jgi:WD40 repeat protein